MLRELSGTLLSLNGITILHRREDPSAYRPIRMHERPSGRQSAKVSQCARRIQDTHPTPRVMGWWLPTCPCLTALLVTSVRISCLGANARRYEWRISHSVTHLLRLRGPDRRCTRGGRGTARRASRVRVQKHAPKAILCIAASMDGASAARKTARSSGTEHETRMQRSRGGAPGMRTKTSRSRSSERSTRAYLTWGQKRPLSAL